MLAPVLLAGCSGYYWQAAAGQASLMRARVPMAKVLADPATPATLRRQLLLVDDALLFAHLELALPRTKSYRQYADLGRPYVVWNVFAAPEFSLEPRQWCYPIAGCATYRGWFTEERAQTSAARLVSGGDDVFIGGVAAYSTLGWFADPVLNTMLGDSDEGLAGLLFHELAHQRFYVPGDTLFNEGFATLVEDEGTRRWLASRSDETGLCRLEVRQSRRTAVLGIIDELRNLLAGIYASDAPIELRRRQRAAAFDQAQVSYAQLRAGWTEPPWFDSWFEPGLNNARLAALASYADYMPAFRALLVREGGDLARFYASVEALGDRDLEDRKLALQELALQPMASVSVAPASGSCP
jgi:predicted aminopeptidase